MQKRRGGRRTEVDGEVKKQKGIDERSYRRRGRMQRQRREAEGKLRISAPG